MASTELLHCFFPHRSILQVRRTGLSARLREGRVGKNDDPTTLDQQGRDPALATHRAETVIGATTTSLCRLGKRMRVSAYHGAPRLCWTHEQTRPILQLVTAVDALVCREVGARARVSRWPAVRMRAFSGLHRLGHRNRLAVACCRSRHACARVCSSMWVEDLSLHFLMAIINMCSIPGCFGVSVF